ncbi:MAG: recombinase family protein [Dehalococcoidales bacterium]|nr:recombinase family protein [Dehalococcoidales bacterium]
MKAAIYCRVSTEDQEREGTSLQSQLEACLKLARGKGYEVEEEYVIREIYSGLTIDRPDLTRLINWIHGGEVDAVVIYDSDRFSRDGYDFVTLIRGCQKANVELLCVTEPIEHGPIGELLSFVRGWASMREAEKIKERTMRGLRERAKSGKMPSGRRARLFGYNYIPGKGVGEGIRYPNDAEAKWVKQIFNWFVNEGLGIDRISYKLRDLDIPTPSGKGLWYASEVWKILRNRAYIGETYVFTQTYGEPKVRLSKGSKTRKTGLIKKPREEWIEIPGATPPIINPVLFEMAQAQLKRNKDRASRNMKQQYLLSGHIQCQRCNRNYWGYVKRAIWSGKSHPKRYYRCAGKLKMISPVPCENHNLNADRIESVIWGEIEKLLSKPELIVNELERKKAEINQESLLEQELSQITRRLADLDREQQNLLQWALKGFPEETVARENEKINRQRVELKEQEVELKRKMDTARQSEIDMTGVEQFCVLARQNLSNFSYEDKRLALEALQVKVHVDGSNVSMTGAIPVATGDIVSTRPG